MDACITFALEVQVRAPGARSLHAIRVAQPVFRFDRHLPSSAGARSTERNVLSPGDARLFEARRTRRCAAPLFPVSPNADEATRGAGIQRNRTALCRSTTRDPPRQRAISPSNFGLALGLIRETGTRYIDAWRVSGGRRATYTVLQNFRCVLVVYKDGGPQQSA